jgi:hypothetical protein
MKGTSPRSCSKRRFASLLVWNFSFGFQLSDSENVIVYFAMGILALIDERQCLPAGLRRVVVRSDNSGRISGRNPLFLTLPDWSHGESNPDLLNAIQPSSR